MKDLLSCILFLNSIFLGSKDGIIKAKYSYSINLMYESNLITHKSRSLAIINGKRLTCICGEDPILIMIIYGHVQGFCFVHLPYIDVNCGNDCREKECM